MISTASTLKNSRADQRAERIKRLLDISKLTSPQLQEQMRKQRLLHSGIGFASSKCEKILCCHSGQWMECQELVWCYEKSPTEKQAQESLEKETGKEKEVKESPAGLWRGSPQCCYWTVNRPQCQQSKTAQLKNSKTVILGLDWNLRIKCREEIGIWVFVPISM